MKKEIQTKFLNIFYYLQWIVTIVSFALIIAFIFVSYLIFILGVSTSIDGISLFLAVDMLIFDLLAAFFIISVVSISATDNLRNNKPLTKIQKFSLITHPFIVCIYISVVLFIKYNILL